MPLSEKNGNADVDMVVALLAAGKGIGAVILGAVEREIVDA